MDFQILKVILWPNLKEEAPCIHKFEPGKVNIITGASKTGKSALIPVIDYCLGSSRCNIPVGVIRNKCSWYGLLIQHGNKQVLVGRQNPPRGQKQTGQMLFQTGEEIEIPAYVDDATSGRINISATKALLNELAGTTNLKLDDDENSLTTNPPGFRDLLAFNFQPQNIVANPNILFFRTDMAEYRTRMRAILPYALGAQTHDDVIALWELKILKRLLREEEQKHIDKQKISDRWKTSIHADIQKAKDFGLIESSLEAPISVVARIELLEKVSQKGFREIKISRESMDSTSIQVDRQKKRLKSISREMGVLRRRRDELTELERNLPAYQAGLGIQRERLELSKWLQRQPHGEDKCILCGNAAKEGDSELDQLTQKLSDLEADIEDLGPQPASFAKELKRVQSDLFLLTDKFKDAQARLGSLVLSSDETAQKRYQEEEILQFIGTLSKSVELYRATLEDNEKNEMIEDLRGRINKIENEYSLESRDRRQQNALKDISEFAHDILPVLDAEHTDWPIRLDPKDLSLKITEIDSGDESERNEIALWQIGSGANWLAYHVAITIALQRFFLSKGNSPVPSFLVYDQPSQVYFPRAEAKKDEGEDDFSITDQEDVLAVWSVFSALNSAVKDADGGLQIIVLDHAREETWAGLKCINVVDEWRRGKKLVPDSWPDRFLDS